jgi:potassium efflux system protein
MGVGLGFGLQEIVANFVSGLILLAERPVRIGDVVTIGDVSGTVLRIRARATTVTDFENKEVIIPNKAFITGSVVNWTLTDRITRLTISIGVAYGSDIARVQDLLLGAVAAHPEVLRDPPPGAFLVAFADSALTFQISAFVDSLDKRQRVQHELGIAVERVLRESGISMPSPHLDLNIRSAPGLLSQRPGTGV